MAMDQETKKRFKKLSYVSTIGLVLALSICIGALIGYFLDKKLGTDPWLFFVFLIFGIIAGFKNLITMVNKLQDKNEKSD